jgi:DNA-directed RNA polymerase specialized sigma24 family protein
MTWCTESGTSKLHTVNRAQARFVAVRIEQRRDDEMNSESVSLWIDQLKAGDREATGKLWERYFRRLIGLARKRLADRPRLGADAEDVALSAFDSFFRAAEAGKFPKLNDRDELWHLLVTITVRKSQRLVRDQSRQKRGGGLALGESAILGAGSDGDLLGGFDQFIADEPDPAFAAQLAEDYDQLFAKLGDPDLKTIALLKLEGHTVNEISSRIGRAPASIERKLRMIRELWSKELELSSVS